MTADAVSKEFQFIKYLSKNKNDGEGGFPGYRLVFPSVSVGNVGQLAVDLLLENMVPAPVKIGRIFHPALEPVVGYDSVGTGTGTTPPGILTACEIFKQEENKVIILQFRSPVTRRNREDFVQFLTKWIKKSKFLEVLCLGSSLASLRNDTQLNEPSVRYLIGKGLAPSFRETLSKLQLRELEGSEEGNNLQALEIPGSGITKEFTISCEINQIPCLTLIYFASDGDNTPEGMELFHIMNELYNFVSESKNSEQLKIPRSWDFAAGPGLESIGIF